jgi:hypothetical protein
MDVCLIRKSRQSLNDSRDLTSNSFPDLASPYIDATRSKFRKAIYCNVYGLDISVKQAIGYVAVDLATKIGNQYPNEKDKWQLAAKKLRLPFAYSQL